MILEACVLGVILLGFSGLVWQPSLLLKIIALDVMSTGVIGYFVLIAARTGVFTPILFPTQSVTYADPVPQAVILTAIVIGLSTQALMLVGAMKLSKNNPTLELDEIERNYLP
ncbi:cation:proton antiporter subunit C [Thermosynechococcaceae cyanobacterium BACA0444]|uniref:Cation:proton antiporter subunit C n=1 Tax=Pseudocalidococcus azoricus BACA0444 TaxID=2918990 RepID=A0AAE4FQL4_9CYAN|nr:cation:proton antiporter subunit C [Pseudocalidococcus azoricus]MDS3860464.1 cation:proton antiporter subunit C [Pseudocalidococcus azoricus BACA0444]